MTQPTSYTWLVEQPAAPATSDGTSDFAVGGARGCEPCFISQADLLALMERLLPSSYLDPLKLSGPGYEILQMQAKVFERASVGIGILECSQFLLSATGGSKARARVVFYRDVGGPALTQLAGTIVACSKGNQRFRLLAPVTFGFGDLVSTSAVVEAEVTGYEYNVRGQRVTARGEVVPGEIDTIVLPLQDPPYADPAVRVQQFQDAAGGVAAALDAIGSDRGVLRAGGAEADPGYAARIRQLPDTVTPAAIRRLLQRTFAPYGVTAKVIEVWDVRLQTCWSAPPLGNRSRGYDPACFVYNDPRRGTPFRNVWLSVDFARGAFLVVIPKLPPIAQYGGVYNDTAATQSQFVNPFGRRAISAWSAKPDPSVAISWAWNGASVGRRALLKGLWDSIAAAKPVNTPVAFVREDL